MAKKYRKRKTRSFKKQFLISRMSNPTDSQGSDQLFNEEVLNRRRFSAYQSQIAVMYLTADVLYKRYESDPAEQIRDIQFVSRKAQGPELSNLLQNLKEKVQNFFRQRPNRHFIGGSISAHLICEIPR